MLDVKYKCACMKEEATVIVRERIPTEDVVHFVGKVVGDAISRDHRTRSPNCRRTEMEYAKVPMSNDGTVGKRDLH